MSDALPTISADQLTKAVTLAAAGTLCSVEAENENDGFEEWQNNDNEIETTRADKRNTSLKCLETLSTSVSSNLGQLNRMNLDKHCFVYSPRSLKSNAKNNAKSGVSSSSSVVKKYSSRKNYKLMPPLIPSQVRTNIKKTGPEMNKLSATLNHYSNVCSTQDLKQVHVRAAPYTTNYLFVRTAQILPPTSGQSQAEITNFTTSAGDAATIPLPNTASTPINAAIVTSTITEPPVTANTTSKTLSIGTPILLPFSQVEQSVQNIPTMSVTLTSLSDSKQLPRLAPSTKLQPIFRLPFPVNNIHSNVIMKSVSVSKESNKIKEKSRLELTQSQTHPGTNIIDSGAAVCSSDATAIQHILTSSGSTKPGANAVKNIIVPVSTPTCQITLINSLPSPVIMSPKLAQPSALTDGSAISQPHSQSIISPPAMFMSTSPIHTASLSNSHTSSGPVILPSPRYQLITDNSLFQALQASRLKSPVVFAQVTNTTGNKINATQANIVRISGAHVNFCKPVNKHVISTSKTHLKIHQMSKFSSVNDVAGGQGKQVSISSQDVPQLTNLSATFGTIGTQSSVIQSLPPTKPVPASMHISPAVYKSVTGKSIPTHKPHHEDIHKNNKLSSTGLPSPGAVMSFSAHSPNAVISLSARSPSAAISFSAPSTSAVLTFSAHSPSTVMPLSHSPNAVIPLSVHGIKPVIQLSSNSPSAVMPLSTHNPSAGMLLSAHSPIAVMPLSSHSPSAVIPLSTPSTKTAKTLSLHSPSAVMALSAHSPCAVMALSAHSPVAVMTLSSHSPSAVMPLSTQSTKAAMSLISDSPRSIMSVSSPSHSNKMSLSSHCPSTIMSFPSHNNNAAMPVSSQSSSNSLYEKNVISHSRTLSSVITTRNETQKVHVETFQTNVSPCSSTKPTYTVSVMPQVSSTGLRQLNIQTSSSPSSNSIQHLPLTVLAVSSKHQQLQSTSALSMNNPRTSQLSLPNPLLVEVTSKPQAANLLGSTKTSESKDGTAHVLATSADVLKYKVSSTSVVSSPLSSKTSTLTLQTKNDTSLPLSKEVAAAAMVSLSAMRDHSHSFENSAEKLFQNNTPSSPKIISQPSSITTIQAPAQFLIPSTDRTKLVISPAGIEHLQSLLRKQGISEGYFIITSPRIPPRSQNPSSIVTCAERPTFKSVSDNKKDNFISKNVQKEFSVSSEEYSENNLTLSNCEGTFSLKNNGSNITKDEDNVAAGHGPARNEESLDLESDESENENSSSSDSRSSSTALVIETGEEDEKMEIDKPYSETSHKEDDDHDDGDDLTSREDGHVTAREDADESDRILKTVSDECPRTVDSPTKQAQDTTWDTDSLQSDEVRQSIPQSSLSLSDLVKQQQNRVSFSRLEYSFLTSPESSKMKEVGSKNDSESPRLSSSESHDFQFPMPLCRASSFSASSHTQHHPASDMQDGFQHNMFSSGTSFSTELSFESDEHHPGLESQMNENLENNVSQASPKLLSNTINTPSPKSPLSVNSSQALDQNTQLNPPMTPNTMLINLLNRVPTPFLTNPQDLLSAPSSQENVVHEADTTDDFEMADNKRNSGIYSEKGLNYTSGQTHTQLNTSEDRAQSLLYSESSRNTDSYVPPHNALDLIASNYSPCSTRNNAMSHTLVGSQLSSNYSMIGSKTFGHPSYAHCNMSNESQNLNFSENFQQESENRGICNSLHCKSCPGPLLVTVNLEPESSKYVVTLPSHGDKPPENVLRTYEHTHMFDRSLNLQDHGCNGASSVDSSRMVTEKSRETDILRHLILNTSTSSLHTLQPVQNLSSQQYNTSSATFNIPQSHHSQDSQFECRVDAFLEPDRQHKPLPGTDITQGSAFSTEGGNFLHINHVHTQPSPSYENSNTSFQTSAHQSYESTASSSFDNRNSSSLGNQAGASYIMPENMTSETVFSVQDLTKNNMSISHDFIDSNGRLQHLAPFRSENHQSELFYPHAEQPDMHQHHYDPSSQHQGLDYHMDNLPPSHQPHQYTTSSLSHPDSSRMFSDHAGNVEYMNNQYQSQYYDSGGVASSLPMFPQQCVVGSEAPVIGSTADHPCNIPFSNAPRGLQLEYRYPPDDDDGSNIEKQPVLPSASFSPPSVADQAATPDPAGMSMYHGGFPNLNMYDMYMRGSGDARGIAADTVQESGNFCVECNIMYKAQCKFHPCDYVYVSDTPILSHARLTLPSSLRLGISSVVGHTNNTGVFAKDKIAVRTKFGPLIGSPVSCDKLSSTRSFSLWQTFLGNSVKVMDTSDENSSNWLMFIKPAKVSMEQNLVAFQHGSSVYFVTRTDIEPGQELLYWFAKDYSQMLGISSKSKSAHHQLCPHCPVCKQVFPDRKQVQGHVRLQHPKPCTKKCSHCSRRFSQVSHLNTHITSVHLRVKKFVCPQCGKRFSDSSNFRKHVKSHSDERLFKCVICGKDFRQKAHLKLHMNTHMPVKNEQCGYCGERFTRAFTRRQHELQHTKLNKIPCAHCDKIFYKQQVYKQHLKIHNNERKYVCPHCSKAFRTKANLTRHGPSCKQQKCVVLPPPPPPPISGSQIQAGDFLHTNHSEVSLPAYSNDASSSTESV